MMFWRNNIPVLVIFLSFVNCHASELFTSTTKIEAALRNLEKLTISLEKYIQNEEIRIDYMQRSLENLKTLQSRYAPQAYTGDTARLYSLSSAFTSEWNHLDVVLSNKESKDFYSELTKWRELLPTEDDYRGLIMGIAGVQTIYNISAEEFAAGEVFGLKLAKLSVLESYSIGCELLKRRFFRLAIDWFGVTARMLNNCNKCNLVLHEDAQQSETYNLTLDIIERKIQIAEEMIRGDRNSLQGSKKRYEAKLHTMDKTNINAEILVDLLQKIDTGNYEHFGAEYMRNINFSKTHEMLCKDNTSFTKVSERLPMFLSKCHYFVQMPQFQPMKLEVISHDPVLVIVHDILSNAQTDKIIAENIDKVSRSLVVTANGSQTTSDVRASQSFQIKNETTSFKTYHMRLEALLNRKLSMNTEPFKVTNYGPGGSFGLHVDYWQTEQIIKRLSVTKTNRLITFLFYLSDVAGGATVFPKAGLKIVPKKGSMAAWININADGTANKDTLHAGCPVITGSKWIMSRYLHVEDHNIGQLQKYLVNPFSTPVQ